MCSQQSSFPHPPVTDQSIYDVVATKLAFPTLAISVEIGLYEYLSRQARTTAQIAAHLQIDVRVAEIVVSVVAALGFLASHEDGRFDLTETARTYLLVDSPFFRRDLVGHENPVVDQLRRALRSREPIQPFAVKIGELPDESLRAFIGGMHAITLPSATGLSEQPVFAGIRNLLDVGGGSGSLSLAVASRHPEIRCTIMDLEPVCKIAEANIASYGLASRIKVTPGDMFGDPWPSGHDGLLFGNIFHDWDLESCRLLASRAYETLEPGGVVCLHEMLLNERKDGPLTVACFSVSMLLHEKGKQFAASELRKILQAAGFVDFQATPSYGYYWLVTASKT